VYPERNNSGNFGLDVYEPHFLAGRGDWLAAAEEGDSDLGYEVKLTLTDQAYTNDLFYFWCAPARRARPRAYAAAVRPPLRCATPSLRARARSPAATFTTACRGASSR